MRYFFILLILAAGCARPSTQTPNIILIVADDLGYADLGFMGSEISTPTIDSLRRSGMYFSRFHTASLCAPTRAMLLSGNDNHVAGMGVQGMITDHFGYEGGLTQRIKTMPSVLRESGYHTFMAGKWHIGYEREKWPDSMGFQRYFAMHQGAGNHYNGIGLTADNPSTYSENGELVDWPVGQNSTEWYTRKLISYLKSVKDDENPFFAYAAYTAPHWPLQVDESYWEKYEERFSEGYESLRKENARRLEQAGVLGTWDALPPLDSSVVAWDSLTADQRKVEIRKMALYAGMVEHLDGQLNRLFQFLRKEGLENTLIIFMSDNGPDGLDFYNHGGEAFMSHLQAMYDNSYENMGTPSSFVSYGIPWAESGSGPFRMYKEWMFEGGSLAPLIISGPGIQKNALSHSFTNVTDLAPTIYEWAGIFPKKKKEVDGEYPLTGYSLNPLLTSELDTITRKEPWVMEHAGQAQVHWGPYKLVQWKVHGTFHYALYRVDSDISEITDIKDRNPDIYQTLFKHLEDYKEKYKIRDLETDF